MSGTEKTIDQFAGWEDTSQQHDFFGETNLVEDVVSTVEKDDVVEEDDTKPKGPTKSKEEEEQELIDDQFRDFESGVSKVSTEDDDEDEDKENPAANKDDKKPAVSVNSKSTLEFLKDKGLVDFELEEGQELTEDLAENLLEDSWEQAVEAEVEATIKDLPQEVKDLIKFASKGGDVGQLLAKMANNATSGINKDSDIESEAVQIQAVTTDLLSQGYDQEYIDAQIEFLKESNKLEGISKKAFDKIIAKQEAETASEVEQAAKNKEFRKKQAREYKTNITSHIGGLTEVGGLPVSKQDKAILPTYISEPTVELQDGRVVSELQADLFKVMADKDKIVLLAKLLKSDFDFSPIARKQATAASRKIKEEVQNADKKTLSNGGGSHKPNKKALWDMLED